MWCSKDQVSAKIANSADANCVPLSVTRTSGMPYLAKTSFISLITLLDVTELRRANSMKLL